MSKEQKTAKTVTGEVVSARMDKTVLVQVVRKVRHPLYEKYIKRSSKFMAHDENNQCHEGDTVVIEASRPLSKRKSWRLREIVSRAQQV